MAMIIVILLLGLLPANAQKGFAPECFNSERNMAWCKARQLPPPRPNPVMSDYPKIQVPPLPSDPGPATRDCINIGLVMPPNVICRVEDY